MTASASASDSLVGLPSEVLLTIFGAQDSFRDLSSLFRTSKGLYALWQTHASSISKPLLVRQTPCYEEVDALISASQTLKTTSKLRDGLTLVDSVLEEKLARTLDRIASSRQIAGQARYLCEIIESRYLQQKYNCHDAKCRARPSTLAPQERDEVTRMHHFVKLYGLTCANKSLAELHDECKNRLARMSLADKHLIFQLTKIMHDYALPWDKMRLELYSSWSPSSDTEDRGCSPNWPNVFQVLQEATRVQVTTCENCIYDDTARFSRTWRGEGI